MALGQKVSVGVRRLFSFIVAGYILFNRSFAYIGVPAARIFLGELVLGLSFLLRGRPVLKAFSSLLGLRRMKLVYSALALYLLYGLFQVLRGLLWGHPLVETLRDSAFTYYSLYILVGVYMASRLNDHSVFLRRFSYGLAVISALYGILYIAYLGQLLHLKLHTTPDVWLFAQPTASGAALLMLLALVPMNRRVILLLGLNALILISIQVRAEWLGFIIGAAVLSTLNRNVSLFFRTAAIIVAILGFLYALDLSIPTTMSRGGGEMSVRTLAGRAVAPVDPNLAWEYTEKAGTFESTFLWRLAWWNAIWERASSSLVAFFFGNGYGFDLAGLAGYSESMGLGGLRTPHSFVAWSFGYSGFFGLALFILLQIGLMKFFLEHGKYVSKALRPAALFAPCFMSFWIVVGAFGNSFEAPYVAVPYYTMCGFIMGAICSEATGFRFPSTKNKNLKNVKPDEL